MTTASVEVERASTFNDAEWRIGMMIATREWHEDAMYARRALDALRADESYRRAEAETITSAFGKTRPKPIPHTLKGCKLSEWERETLTRQLMRYVLANGNVPSQEHVKKLRENATQAKRDMPTRSQIRMAFNA